MVVVAVLTATGVASPINMWERAPGGGGGGGTLDIAHGRSLQTVDPSIRTKPGRIRALVAFSPNTRGWKG